MNCFVRAIATLAILSVSGGLLSACTNQNLQILVNQQMAEYFYNRGLERLGNKDYTRAIADFNEVIRRESSNSQAYANRCVARIKIGEIPEAIADCDRAVQLDPKNGDARYNRADLRHHLGDKQGPIEDWRMAASIYRQEGNMRRYQDAMEKYQRYSKERTQGGKILLNSIRSNHQQHPLHR
ncbi:tetratricopeptide repeat protein [Argonema antarcticum]|uniref:tetratricopeptide repeat protein n=1 Tax=Argonema antarcticum TaxID=2942763 RepID=UPI002010DC85|nr:tetratricopeptide repeat protein [Argonema antarcticum]MCL1474749.1 tetratricopeptide repeat protein [Argonema antarcticum A004/B2]